MILPTVAQRLCVTGDSGHDLGLPRILVDAESKHTVKNRQCLDFTSLLVSLAFLLFSGHSLYFTIRHVTVQTINICRPSYCYQYLYQVVPSWKSS
jgi:hypothetical protein